MSNYKLLVKAEANREVIDGYLWYENKQEGLGEKFLDALDQCYNSIDINPTTYEQKYKAQRQAIVKGFPYVVMYEVAQQKIIVYAVFNTFQKPQKKFRG
jgi:hypothetical protein